MKLLLDEGVMKMSGSEDYENDLMKDICATTPEEKEADMKLEKFDDVSMRSPSYLKDRKAVSYMSTPAVKAFNLGLVNRLFNTSVEKKKFESPEQVRDDFLDYIKLCLDTDTIPSVGSVACWLGCNKSYLTRCANNPNSEFHDICSKIVSLCHTITENAAISGNINNLLYMFVSKNYYGMKDDKSLTLSRGADSEPTGANDNETMKALRLQQEQERTFDAEFEEK